MAEHYILFYSVNCRFSNKFIRLLQKYPEVNSKFEKYALESLQQLPSGLTSVPTVMDMSSRKMFASQQAFDWLEHKVKNSFEASMDISGKGDNSLAMSFISQDEKNYSKDYSVLGNEMNNGTCIDPNQFDENGKPRHRGPQNQSNVMPVSPPQMTEQQFRQMNEAMNQQIGADMNNNLPLDAAMAQRQAMGLPNIQKDERMFQQNVNQSAGGGGISQQQFQNYQQQFQKQMNGQFNGNGNAPQLPPQLQPINVSKSGNNLEMAANNLLQQRNQEVPQPMQRAGGGNSMGGNFGSSGMSYGNQGRTPNYNPNVF